MKVPGRRTSNAAPGGAPSGQPKVPPEFALMAAAHMAANGRLFSQPDSAPAPTNPDPQASDAQPA